MGTKTLDITFTNFQLPFCLVAFLFVPLLFASCSTTRNATQSSRSAEQLWDSLGMENSHHTGISVYDVARERYILQINDQKYFTPASNAKFLTLYTALETFDENIPAAYYSQEQDTIIIWGGGDPGIFIHDHHDTVALVKFLMETKKQIVLSDQHFQTTHYGRGWAWDDYPYSYQVERSPLPAYGNKLWIERKNDTINIIPDYFRTIVELKKDTLDQLTRNESGTQFVYRYDLRKPYARSSIPVSLYPRDTREIWNAITGKNIISKKIPFRGGLEIAGSSIDTLAKYIMRDSDNFISEQLFLACALKTLNKMDEKEMINHMLKGSLSHLPDSIRWVDGSGLSRYNQMTPRSIIWLLQNLIKQKGVDYMKEILAAGGKTGTIKGWITTPEGEPFLFAKSGTHRHTFNLSGLLITRKGNLLLFSWMNNHFLDRNTVERKMKIFLQRLYFQL